MPTCDFNTVLTADYQNRTKHHLLTIQAQLLAEILIQGGSVAAVDFNSVLARARANGYGDRTQNKLEMIIAQLLCDISGGSGGGGSSGTSSSYFGSGSPEGVVTAPVGSQYLDISTGQQYGKASGVGNTGWI